MQRTAHKRMSFTGIATTAKSISKAGLTQCGLHGWYLTVPVSIDKTSHNCISGCSEPVYCCFSDHQMYTHATRVFLATTACAEPHRVHIHQEPVCMYECPIPREEFKACTRWHRDENIMSAKTWRHGNFWDFPSGHRHLQGSIIIVGFCFFHGRQHIETSHHPTKDSVLEV